MRVVHVSDSIEGGAGRAALHLHQMLRNVGVDSHVVTLHPKGADPFIHHASGYLRKIADRYMKNVDRLPNKVFRARPTGHWSNNWAPNGTLGLVLSLKPDVVHMHYIGAGAVPVRDFSRVKCPIVWTLHDMMALTGGCHYSGGCERFREACGCCPIINSSSSNDLSSVNWRRKDAAWRNIPMTLVCPSNWMAEMARASSLMSSKSIAVIHNGVDLDCFHPIDRQSARASLGLSRDAFLVAFGSASTSDPRKGLGSLLDALRALHDQGTIKGLELVVFGSGGWQSAGFPIRTHNLGVIREDRLLSLIYSAADVFCSPSHEENLATTAIEALACGTPVVAFHVGGFLDMIEHLGCGYLANPFESGSLLDGLLYIHSRRLVANGLRHAARQRAKALFDGRANAACHLDLYQHLLDEVRRQPNHSTYKSVASRYTY